MRRTLEIGSLGAVLFVLSQAACVAPAPRPVPPAAVSAGEPLIEAAQLDHIALSVRNVEESASWYQKLLGLAPYHKWDNAWLLRRGAFAVGLYACDNCQLGGKAEQTLVMRHYAFLVTPDEFQHLQDRLKKSGQVFDGPKNTGVSWSLFVTDPNGYILEFLHYHDTDSDAH